MINLIKILFVLIIFNVNCVKSQPILNLQTVNDGYCNYIQPSYSNVLKLLFISNSNFVETMNSYKYIKTASGIGYMAKATIPSHFRIIKKDSRSVYMNFAPNDFELISNFRSEIKRVISQPTVVYEDGYETYRLIITNDGLKYKVTFRLKEEEINDYYQGQNISYKDASLIVMID